MRILVLHSRYLSNDVSGENRVVDDEVTALRAAGHDVWAWTPSAQDAGRRELGRLAAGVVWSRRAASTVDDLVRRSRAQVVHIHNLYPMLSPAVIRTAARRVPVVMTLHSYRLLCLPATFVRDGRVCEDCLGRLPWPGVLHACYRGSRAASAAVATSLAVHRAVTTFDNVTLFLAVSEFVREKHASGGIPRERIRVKPNFVTATERRHGAGDYFLFLGRLSREKGLDVLLQAWRETDPRLLVVGDGPDAKRLRAAAPANVEFKPPVAPGDVPLLLAGARALVLPSVTFEGSPRSVIEAYAAGVPVVASRSGALPELVAHDDSGLLVRPNDVDAWRAAIDHCGDPATSVRLGRGAARRWHELHEPGRGVHELEASYEAALAAPAARVNGSAGIRTARARA